MQHVIYLRKRFMELINETQEVYLKVFAIAIVIVHAVALMYHFALVNAHVIVWINFIF